MKIPEHVGIKGVNNSILERPVKLTVNQVNVAFLSVILDILWVCVMYGYKLELVFMVIIAEIGILLTC